ncbi:MULTISPECIES: hypothetical protein [Vibrio]|uniref:hypothetical protein n=1 Tax=Vibrio TaxID=662 RepID=UPI0003B1EADA|nr:MULTISPECIES: hypothetical protein [Vibrio]UAB71802.1 hypothetical protein INR79_07885 [Vibrio sp. SCSIO 43132]CCN73323.1 exported hypothetical protein [Vibrio nigripulchritudo SFn118]
MKIKTLLLTALLVTPVMANASIKLNQLTVRCDDELKILKEVNRFTLTLKDGKTNGKVEKFTNKGELLKSREDTGEYHTITFFPTLDSIHIAFHAYYTTYRGSNVLVAKNWSINTALRTGELVTVIMNTDEDNQPTHINHTRRSDYINCSAWNYK